VRCEVVFFNEQDLQATTRRISGNARAIDTTSDNDDIEFELLLAQNCPNDSDRSSLYVKADGSKPTILPLVRLCA